MDRLNRIIALLLLLGAAPGVLAERPSPLAAFDAAWAGYQAGIADVELQFGCRPRRYRPPADGPRRGAILALHGFSACPQQFFQLGPELAARGYDVLVPILPGHGLLPDEAGNEDLSTVPTAETWAQAYGGLAVQMNDIMLLSPGQRVVVGYSLGGTLAINAAFRDRELYERMLLIAPLIAIRGGEFVEFLGDLAGRFPGVRDWKVKPASYQEICDAWTAAGRAGFCDYRYEHVPALIQLTNQNRDWGRKQRLSLPIQVIVADADSVISNGAIEALVADQRQYGPVELCMLRGGVPHEILTPYENVEREMHWLDQFVSVAAAFATQGVTDDCRI
ncbi:MAG: alpha/beta fold hydrolase [Gammaproteobacteria bacterium]|nr:alpha/beta fold hydrolase [Gammaproteobacteria bacterium]